ncbi:MAG: Gfo/Idh/MocA family oxidoreductase [Rhodospirillaceae bacterium]|nr:Gfo/Idh/MocA family oxidoreductase [Rhodospirillaceae bacterium]
MIDEVGAPSRVAVIGCGYFARFHHEAWSRLPRAQVVAVCDLDEDRAAEMARMHPSSVTYTDAAKLLAEVEVDLIDIVSPPATHGDLVRLAAKHGVDAICQKPLAPSREEAAEIVAVAEGAGITLVVHENFRFQPWFQEIHRLVSSGRLGRIHSVAFRMRPGDGQGPTAYLDRQPYFQAMPRFLMHETGIHFVDTFRMILGEITGVFARLRKVNPVIAGEDAGYVVFDFEDGATGILDANRSNDHRAENKRLTMGEMWLEGEAGVLMLNGDGGLTWRPHGGEDAPHDYTWSNAGFGGDCVFATQEYILSALRSGEEPINSGRAYMRNVDIVEAIYRSSQEGRWISLV